MPPSARQAKIGINLATSGSWSTGTADATAVGAGDGHYVLGDLAIQQQTMQSEDRSAGQDFIGSVQGSFTRGIEAQIPMYLHYHDTFLNPLLALALGTGATAPTQLGGSTAYTGTFAPGTNTTGLYASIVQDKSDDIYEVPGAKFTGFEISTGDMGRVEVRFFFIGDLEKEDSTINTSDEVAALTFPTQGRRWFLDDMVFRVNAQGGSGLASGDELKVTAFKTMFRQPYDVKNVGGQTTIIEPEQNGFPECEIEVEFARSEASTIAFFAGHRNTTAYKADAIFTGPAIGTLATTYGLALQFPNLYVPEYQNPIPEDGQQFAPKAKFRALSTTSAPTGMSATTPIHVITTGERSANPFA